MNGKGIIILKTALFLACALLVVFSNAVYALESTNITRETALKCISNSNNVADEMINEGFNVQRVNDSLKMAQSYYDSQHEREKKNASFDYYKVIEYCNGIEKIRKDAFNAKDEIFVLEEEYRNFAEKMEKFRINISGAESMIIEIRGEMADERYEKAIEKIPNARKKMAEIEASATTFNLYYKAATRGFKEWIAENWKRIIGFIIFIAAFYVSYKLYLRKFVLRRKIGRLEVEKKAVQELVKKTQKQYYEQGSMAEGEFNIKTKKYAEMIRDIERQIPLLKEELAMMEHKFKNKVGSIKKRNQRGKNEAQQFI